MEAAQFQETFARIKDRIGQVVVGQEDLVVGTLVGAIARGHVLVEGVPGLGKTLAARALAAVSGCTFKRIQFTPDLMPSDITGSSVYSRETGSFSFVPGPVFTQLLLADEINRAPAKTQSALLEAMQDHQVTVDGTSRPLPAPFVVIATQNPVESHGTYPLPEALAGSVPLQAPGDRSAGRGRAAHRAPARRRLRPDGPLAPSARHERRRDRGHAGATRAGSVSTTPLSPTSSIWSGGRATTRRSRLRASPRARDRAGARGAGHRRQRGRAFVTPDDVKPVVAPCSGTGCCCIRTRSCWA